MDSAPLHEAAHRLHDGDAVRACAALLAFVAELAVEHERTKLELERVKLAQACMHQSAPERGETPARPETW